MLKITSYTFYSRFYYTAKSGTLIAKKCQDTAVTRAHGISKYALILILCNTVNIGCIQFLFTLSGSLLFTLQTDISCINLSLVVVEL